MFLSSSQPRSRQSLPHVHPRPDSRVQSPRCSPGCRSVRPLSQFRLRRDKSAPSCSCPSEAPVFFSPSFVALRLVPRPPLHRANLAPRQRRHAPKPEKLPDPNLAPPPLPTLLARSNQTVDIPLRSSIAYLSLPFTPPVRTNRV